MAARAAATSPPGAFAVLACDDAGRWRLRLAGPTPRATRAGNRWRAGGPARRSGSPMTGPPHYPFTVAVAPGDAPDPAAVAAALGAYGLAHLPAAVRPGEVAVLRRTCLRLLDAPPPGAEPMPYGNGTGWRAERAALAGDAPGLVAAFDHPWMASVAGAFFWRPAPPVQPRPHRRPRRGRHPPRRPPPPLRPHAEPEAVPLPHRHDRPHLGLECRPGVARLRTPGAGRQPGGRHPAGPGRHPACSPPDLLGTTPVEDRPARCS